MFHLADIADKLRMLLQSLVALRVLAHVVDTDLLKGREGRIGSLYLMDDARLGVLGNPLGEIMDAAGIAPDEPPTITHIHEGMLEGVVAEVMPMDTEREGHHILHQRSAVELTRVDHKAFWVVALEGSCHVWTPDELLGKEERQVGGCRQLAGFVQQLAHRDTVGGQFLDLFPCRYSHRPKQQDQYRVYR